MNRALWGLVLALSGCGDKEGEPAGDSAADSGSPPGDSDPPTEPDADGDGFSDAEDCDDGDPGIYPDAPEVCDDADNDCDLAIDEDAADATTWHPDGDGDGYGDGAAIAACEQPAGHAAPDGDCDDADPSINPGSVEVCGGGDEDCDGTIDEAGAAGAAAWYADADGDGFGDAAASAAACAAPAGYIADNSDCDDGDVGAYPGAAEACDEADDDCDGAADEDAADAPTWYPDADGDGYGASGGAQACEAPPGYVGNDDDCDDSDASITPLDEICACGDGLDNDGDGLADCEDGDCAAEAGCGEECADEADNDADGLVDCDDDECWGTALCVESVAWVNSGEFAGGVRNWYHHSPAGGGGEDGSSGFTFWNSAWSVQGSVQLRSSALALSTTCTWSLTYAAWSEGRSYGWENWFGVVEADRWSEFYTPVERAGVALSPACPVALDVEALLPSRLGASVGGPLAVDWGSVAYAGPGLLSTYPIGVRWYVPGAWTSSPRVASTYTPGSYPGWGWLSSYQTDWAGAMTTGEAYDPGAWPP